MDDAGFILNDARNDEFVRVNDDADLAAVIVKSQVEDRQTPLRGDRNAHSVSQRQSARTGERFFSKKRFGQYSQALFFLVVKPPQERECGDGFLP